MTRVTSIRREDKRKEHQKKTTEEDSKTETKEGIYFQTKSQKNTYKDKLWENHKNSYCKAQARIICNNCVVNDATVMYLFNWAKRNTGLVNCKRTFQFCGQKPNCEELSWECQKIKWRKLVETLSFIVGKKKRKNKWQLYRN